MNYTNKKNTGIFIKENVSFKARNTTHNRDFKIMKKSINQETITIPNIYIINNTDLIYIKQKIRNLNRQQTIPQL